MARRRSMMQAQSALAVAMAASMDSHRSPFAIGAALPKEHVLRMGAQAKHFAAQRAAAAKAIERQAALRAELKNALVPHSGDCPRHMLAVVFSRPCERGELQNIVWSLQLSRMAD